jgi:hydroxyacyl-ACP dehydratase HTD2-like protein with hotdog domain
MMRLEPGVVCPPLDFTPTHLQLFRFSAVSWNSHRIHYDQAHARGEGVPDVVVQSTLHGEMFARAALRWAGPGAALRRVEWRNRATAYAGVPLTCSGRVSAVAADDRGHVVEFDLTETAADGTVCTTGVAEVHIPSA